MGWLELCAGAFVQQQNLVEGSSGDSGISVEDGIIITTIWKWQQCLCIRDINFTCVGYVVDDLFHVRDLNCSIPFRFVQASDVGSGRKKVGVLLLADSRSL